MAGRPRGLTFIVPANEVLHVNDILAEEVWRLSTLLPNLSRDEQSLQWCARHRLLRNTASCAVCMQPCTLTRYAGGLDGVRWACQTCNYRKSVRDGSFFARSHLSIQQIIIMTYCWACDLPQQQMLREADIARPNTAVDWCNFLREECEQWISNNSEEIGGMDAAGEAIVVEIDETKYFHRKYHRGAWREGHWVFGGIERQSGRCFLVEVPDRRAVTLGNCISQYILPGSHIVSDGWAAYAHIDMIRQGIYTHSVIVHKNNFVDPYDPSSHTQNIENMWMRAKRKLKRQFGTSRPLFPSYLHEFVYRNRFRNSDVFANLLVTIGDNYQ